MITRPTSTELHAAISTLQRAVRTREQAGGVFAAAFFFDVDLDVVRDELRIAGVPTAGETFARMNHASREIRSALEAAGLDSTQVSIVGSVGRGDSQVGDDVDVLVVLADGAEGFSAGWMQDQIELEDALSDLICVRADVHVAHESELDVERVGDRIEL